MCSQLACLKRRCPAQRFVIRIPRSVCPAARSPPELISNTHSAGAMNVTIHFREISRREHDLPRDAGHALGNKHKRTLPFLSQTIHDSGDMARVTHSKIGFSSPVNAAIVVGDWGDMDPRFASASTGSVKFVRTYVNECGRVAVIGVFQDDNVVVSGAR